MNTLLIIILILLIFGGGGGYYAHRNYGGAGLGGVLGFILIVLARPLVRGDPDGNPCRATLKTPAVELRAWSPGPFGPAGLAGPSGRREFSGRAAPHEDGRRETDLTEAPPGSLCCRIFEQ